MTKKEEEKRKEKDKKRRFSNIIEQEKIGLQSLFQKPVSSNLGELELLHVEAGFNKKPLTIIFFFFG